MKPTESVYRCYDQPDNEQLDFSTGLNFCSYMAIENIWCSSEQKVNISHPTCQLIIYFSFFYRLKLAVFWLLRFKTYLQSKTRNKNLTQFFADFVSVDELCTAENNVIEYVQRTCFTRESACVSKNKQLPKTSPLHKLNPIVVSGLLQVGGRLDGVLLPYDLKHPIILPVCHSLTELIIRDTHEQAAGHCGVNDTLNMLRQRLWIINAKVAVRRVVTACVTCKRVHSYTQTQIMSELPIARFQINKPAFSLDYDLLFFSKKYKLKNIFLILSNYITHMFSL